MKKIHFEQIICTSSQKSQTTGSAGFGVRSKSAGISNKEAYELYTRTGINYSLPTDLKATEEVVKDNPDMERLYPSIYTFKSIQLQCNGEIRYVIGRTLYIAIEYGYFGQMDSSRRAGSNYIAHLLVFKELPDMSVLSHILKNKLFYPYNTLCSPENKEMCSLLIGDPIPLDEGYISIDETREIENVNNELGWLIIALLQAYKDQRVASNNSSKNIIFKVNSNKVFSLLCTLGALPKEITNGLFLQANTMTCSNVPEGAKMLILNEKNPTPTEDEYYITVDLLGKEQKTHNIDDNYLYKQILKCCQEQDVDTLRKTVDLFLRMISSNNSDYEFSFSMMLLSSTPKELSISELDVNTLKKLSLTSLSPKDENIVWNKVNKAINDVFRLKRRANEVRIALEDVSFLNKECPSHLSINSESCDFIVDLLFNKSEWFVEILGSSNDRLEGALYMIKNAQKFIPSPTAFWEALSTSDQLNHWEKFILLYYEQDLKENIEVIINNIMQSKVQEKEKLTSKLFPIKEFVPEWISLISSNKDITKTFGNYITDFFDQSINADPNKEMFTFLSIDKEARDSLDTNRLTNTYISSVERNSGLIDKGLLMKIRDSLEIQSSTKGKIDTLLNIIDEEPLAYVDTETINKAKNISNNKNYLFKLFNTWINSNPPAIDIADFVNSTCETSNDVANILDTVWKALPKRERTKYTLQISDHIRWQRFNFNRVVELLLDKELKQTLIKENSFTSKLVRKATSALISLITNPKK
jgi:hypothetical protein